MKHAKYDRKQLFIVLREMDHDDSNTTTFSMFQQAAMDNNIVFDEKSIEYIIKFKCDKVG